MKNSKSSKAKYLQVPDEFYSIQYAIDNSNTGDIIQISGGKYQENLRIEKSIALITNRSNVIIAPKQEDQPIIDIGGNNIEATIQGVVLDGNSESTTNKKVGISINEGSLILRECKFRNWNINLDDAPVDDDDFWENLRITGIQADGATNLLTIDNCKFENCDNGIHITGAKIVELTNNELANCDIAISISRAKLLSNNNLIINCGTCVWAGQDTNIESRQDVFKDVGEFISCGNTSGFIIFDDAIISTVSFISLALGDLLTHRDTRGTWILRTPRIILANGIAVIKTNDITFRFASSYNQEWGLPQLNVLELFEIEGNTSVTINGINLSDKSRNKEHLAEISQAQMPRSSHGFLELDHKQLDLTGGFGNTLDLISSTSKSHFVTGKAGTGKSTLLRLIVEKLQKNIALLAPTGIAAVNVEGETIHSFFGFPPRPITDDDISQRRNQDLYRALDVIIIDEVSMVRADLMDAIDKFMRMNGRNPLEPFGGTQMLFFGDIFQLQPVISGEEEEKYLSSNYNSPYFFDAKVFDEFAYEIIDLKKVYRQKDLDFIELLDSIRLGTIKPNQIAFLNNRYRPNYEIEDEKFQITLTSTNRLASDMNERMLEKIPTKDYLYLGTIEGEYPRKSLPTELTLRLKVGAQIMLVKNDTRRRWVNGTIGRIHELGEDYISVEIQNGSEKYIYPIGKMKWEILKHRYDFSSQKISTEVIGAFTQYPIRLAWAVTIHKSQGLTFENTVVDLGSGAFAHGQTYVALSRCTALDGIILKKRINISDIIVDNSVKTFYRAKVLKLS